MKKSINNVVKIETGYMETGTEEIIRYACGCERNLGIINEDSIKFIALVTYADGTEEVIENPSDFLVQVSEATGNDGFGWTVATDKATHCLKQCCSDCKCKGIQIPVSKRKLPYTRYDSGLILPLSLKCDYLYEDFSF